MPKSTLFYSKHPDALPAHDSSPQLLKPWVVEVTLLAVSAAMIGLALLVSL